MPASGAVEAWQGWFERSGGPHTGEDTWTKAGMDVAPQGKPAEEGPVVSGHSVCSPQEPLFALCLSLQI